MAVMLREGGWFATALQPPSRTTRWNCVAQLEVDPHAQLAVSPLIVGLAILESSKTSGTRRPSRIRSAKVGMIEGVEELAAQLETDALGELKRLRHIQIHVVDGIGAAC